MTTAALADQPQGIPGNLEKSFQIIKWCRTTGPNLSHIQRLVLMEMGFYSDFNGSCYPSQDTLAANINCARGTVCAAIRDLEALGLIEVSARTDIEGNHNQYRLMGATNGWEPMYHSDEGKKPLIVMLCDTIKDQKTQIVRLEQRLADVPEAESQPELQEGSSSFISTNPGNDDDYYYEEPNVSDADIWFQKFRSEVRQWVDTHWESLRQSPSNPAGWKGHKDKAVNWYVANPARFEEQRLASLEDGTRVVTQAESDRRKFEEAYQRQKELNARLATEKREAEND